MGFFIMRFSGVKFGHDRACSISITSCYEKYKKGIQVVVCDGKLYFTFYVIFKSTCCFESFVKQN